MPEPTKTLFVPLLIRGCGEVKEDGTYFISEIAPDGGGTLPTAVRIDPPIPVDFEFFRGFRIIWPHAIDLRMPVVTWWAGTSRDVEQARALHTVDLKLFGMPWSKRRNAGLCKDCKFRPDAVVVYKYRLAEQTTMTQTVRLMDFLDLFRWPYIRGAEEIQLLLLKRKWGKALAAIWRNWWPAPQDYYSLTATYVLLSALAGEEEAAFFTYLSTQKLTDPDRFGVVEDEEEETK